MNPGTLQVVRPAPFVDADEAHGSGDGSPLNGAGPATVAVPTLGGEEVDPKEVGARVERMNAFEAIEFALSELGAPNLMFAVSFQKTSSVIVDIAHRIDPASRFFYLDTDLLFGETYATRDALAERYGIEFERGHGLSLAEQTERFGANLWRRDPDACCGIRKVEPMRQALQGASGWVAGIRREESRSRAGAAKFGWDKRFGLWKLNPLADWTEQMVWDHIRENQVPYNPLHEQGYPSIGCTHCTVKPAPGEDSRSGRWLGADKTECGING
ncbi:phosphoadenylyl-sulfate reductase [Thermoleophilia bacterium SCSIO 60948]|nr:phosphoadenylyl-sulfate reductase [Thermoleophilia bacterium SCSIO 60948]